MGVGGGGGGDGGGGGGDVLTFTLILCSPPSLNCPSIDIRRLS